MLKSLTWLTFRQNTIEQKYDSVKSHKIKSENNQEIFKYVRLKNLIIKNTIEIVVLKISRLQKSFERKLFAGTTENRKTAKTLSKVTSDQSSTSGFKQSPKTSFLKNPPHVSTNPDWTTISCNQDLLIAPVDRKHLETLTITAVVLISPTEQFHKSKIYFFKNQTSLIYLQGSEIRPKQCYLKFQGKEEP